MAGVAPYSKDQFASHLATTWYKNKLGLRVFAESWDPECFSETTPPSVLLSRQLGTHIWSIPGYLGNGCVTCGCYDGTVRALQLHDLSEKWTIFTGGNVYSSPALLSDSSMVIGSEDGKLRRISSSGEVQWEFFSGASFHSTPTVDPARRVVYAGAFNGTMYALSLADGGCLWSVITHPDVEDDVYSSPALTQDGAIIYGTGFEFVRVEPNGHIAFRTAARDLVESTPAIDWLSNRGIVGSADGHIYVFDIRSCAVVSALRVGSPVNSSAGLSPNGIACLGSDNKIIYGIHLQSGDLRWTTQLSGRIGWTPIAVSPAGNFLMVDMRGDLYGIDADTGAVIWQTTIERGVHSAPLCLPNGQIAVGSHFGSLYILGWD